MHSELKYMIRRTYWQTFWAAPQCILWKRRSLASRNGWGATYRGWRQDVGGAWGGVPGPSGNTFWRCGCQGDYSGAPVVWVNARWDLAGVASPHWWYWGWCLLIGSWEWPLAWLSVSDPQLLRGPSPVYSIWDFPSMNMKFFFEK